MKWQRSSRCMNSGCVEVGRSDGVVRMRKTANPDEIVYLAPEDFAKIVKGIKSGELDDFNTMASLVNG